VLSLGAIANPMFALKGPAISKRSFPPAFPLKHQQKDMRLALELGAQLALPLPVAAAADEVYKKAMAAGCGDNDFAAVYNATLPPK
jgi:glyoxylate/succinic semialdehyde reductase